MKSKGRKLRVLALCGLPLALLLSGCHRAPIPDAGNSVAPTATEMPVAMDEVLHVSRDERMAEFPAFYGVKVLRWHALYFGDVREHNPEFVLVPLRPLGEAMMCRVNWNPKRRRVTFNSEPTAFPITLIDGRSYLAVAQIEEWLDCKALVHFATPVNGRANGSVELVRSDTK